MYNVKIIVVIVGLLGAGFGAKYYYIDLPAQRAAIQAEKDKEQEKAKLEALKKFMNQGDGTIRKPGQSGFKSFDLKHL